MVGIGQTHPYQNPSHIKGATKITRNVRFKKKTKKQTKCKFGCGRSFKSDLQRHSHEKYRHPQFIRYYGCKLCDHVTPYPSTLPPHLRKNHDKQVPRYARMDKNRYVYVTEWVNPDRVLHRASLYRGRLAEFNAKMQGTSGLLV